MHCAHIQIIVNINWVWRIKMSTVFNALEKSNQTQENEQIVMDHFESQKLAKSDDKDKIKNNYDIEFQLFKENIDPGKCIRDGFIFPEEYQIKT